MGDVFVYWDNSNIFHEVQRLANERNGTPGASYRVRIHFDNLLRLAHADRSLKQAFAAGLVPPEMRSLWNRMENLGVKVHLYDRGEQEVPDGWLQQRMMENALRNIETPGIAVLLTGDGAGCSEGRGFHMILELLHERGWGIEVLSWRHACKRRMREWAEANGVFVSLDDHYDAITFLEPSKPGFPLAMGRPAEDLDLKGRATVQPQNKP